MTFFDKTFKDILFSESVSLIGGLLAGFFLAVYTDKLFLIPGMLIVLPGFLEMRGNISGSLASRLSSGLFLKVVKPRNIRGRIVQSNLLASFILCFAVALSLGLLAFLFNSFVFHITTYKIIFFPLIAALIANLIEVPLTIAFTFYLFKKGHDPNNIIGPIITSTGDVISICSLLLVLFIL